MAATKYGNLLKKLKYEASEVKSKAGAAEYMTMAGGVDLEGINLSFAWGYRHWLGGWGSDGGFGHTHPYGECLLFTGLEYARPDYLGAEIELALGSEKHLIDSPAIVVLPAGVPHCPLTSKKVARPFGFLAVSLSGEHKIAKSPRAGKPEQSDIKTGELVQKMELRDTKRKSGGNADFISWWNGKDREGFNLNFTWAFHTGLGAWHDRDPHVHPNDECLVFMGLDPGRPDYLGAELEIAMGKDPEIHVFDTPTAVVIPAGLVHCPLVTSRVDKPYGFSAISLNTAHETTWLGKASS